MAVHVKKIKNGGEEGRRVGPSLRRAPPVYLSIRGPICKWSSLARRRKEKVSFSVSPVYSVSLGARIMPSLTVYQSRKRGV